MEPSASFHLELAIPALAALIAIQAGQQEQPPRFRLETGQELVYEGSSTFRYENGSHETTGKVTFWVTRQNGDGSWHVVAHSESTFVMKHGDDARAVTPGDKQEAFGSFDLFPDGRIANAPGSYQDRPLTGRFFRLPIDENAARAGWQVEEEPGEKQVYRLSDQSDPASGKWVFEKTEQGVFALVYLGSSKEVVHFEARRGVITRAEAEWTQGYGCKGKGTGLSELKSLTSKQADWMARLAEEVDIFEKAKVTMRDAAKSGENVEKSREALRLARDRVNLPLVVAQFDPLLRELEGSAKYHAEAKKQRECVLNKPAAKWAASDLDGKKHSLAGYRGKVVVLDFWYRGCGWCVKAMPQVKEVCKYFQGKPVVVLGMNTDSDENDARFVADKLQLNYPTLRAKGVPEKYGVQGFPTLIVIDRDGVLRGWHAGYSPTLREELVKTIEGLLGDGK